MAVKRRIVWFNDEEWAAIKDRAAAKALSPSAYMRSIALGLREVLFSEPAAIVGPMTVDRSAQQERDAILNRVNRKKTGEVQ